MDYEKLYKESLERAKKLHKDAITLQLEQDIKDYEYIFPELKESEDERIRGAIIDYLKDNALIEWAAWLEKQGEQILANSAKTCKNEQNPADKVEPMFKVKYAGGEYNVLEVKDIAGVTFYGIEDEPNHIDYVQAENCERVGGYSIKEDMSPFPTQPAKFSKQKPAWSENDEKQLNDIIELLPGLSMSNRHNWLKSLKDRIQPQWKPSDEQMDNLSRAFNGATYQVSLLRELYNDLKKLRKE